jgi:hypothetical protein
LGSLRCSQRRGHRYVAAAKRGRNILCFRLDDPARPKLGENLRTIDPKQLRGRLEAAYAAFMEYWLSFSDRWAR